MLSLSSTSLHTPCTSPALATNSRRPRRLSWDGAAATSEEESAGPHLPVIMENRPMKQTKSRRTAKLKRRATRSDHSSLHTTTSHSSLSSITMTTSSGRNSSRGRTTRRFLERQLSELSDISLAASCSSIHSNNSSLSTTTTTTTTITQSMNMNARWETSTGDEPYLQSRDLAPIQPSRGFLTTTRRAQSPCLRGGGGSL
jgi:hypothetical protein